jgi:hypothetical protein
MRACLPIERKGYQVAITQRLTQARRTSADEYTPRDWRRAVGGELSALLVDYRARKTSDRSQIEASERTDG